MVKVGITGGIGSGKSIVCKIFEQLGIAVYYADAEAKKLYEDKAIKQKVSEAIGSQILDTAGNIDKKKLAALVFKEPMMLEKLNAIVHPAVVDHFLQWTLKHEKEKYILKEAAILFESGTNKGLDYIIAVSSPVELRINRTIIRDKISKEEVERRIKNQMSEEEKIKRSDFVIVNDEQQLLIPQVLAIHQQLIKKN